MNRGLHLSLATIAVAALVSPLARAQSVEERRSNIIAAYACALGRLPADQEIAYWLTQNNVNGSVDQMVNKHRAFLRDYPEERKLVIRRSYQIAMGRDPGGLFDQEMRDQMSGPVRIYSELLADHVAWMRSGRPWIQLRGDALKDMVDRAYKAAGFTWYATPLGLGRKSDAEKKANLLYDDADLDTWKNEVKSTGIYYGQIVLKHLKFKADYCGKPFPTPAARIEKATTSQLSRIPGGNEFTSGGGNIVALGGGNIIALGGGNASSTTGSGIVALGGGNMVTVAK